MELTACLVVITSSKQAPALGWKRVLATVGFMAVHFNPAQQPVISVTLVPKQV
jgi:hypothetical protein